MLLTKERKAILTKNKPTLLNYITQPKLENILMLLAANEILTDDEVTMVKTKATVKAQLDELIGYISRGENHFFDGLLEVLRDDDIKLNALADILEQADTGHVSAPQPRNAPVQQPRTSRGATAASSGAAPTPAAPEQEPEVPGIPNTNYSSYSIRCGTVSY